jgi:hypothetical protein
MACRSRVPLLVVVVVVVVSTSMIQALPGQFTLMCCDTSLAPGPPKSVSTGCWRGLTALALVGGNGSPPCPKSQAQQLISLIPTT